jgi:hypothetical protein
MHDMAETPEHKKSRPWRTALIITVLVAALAATGAFAATVTLAPTISGDASTGSTLTASAGSWTPSSATAEYTWLRCDASASGCVGITGACGRSYEVRAADEGHTLRARLTATESNGNAASADSDPTAVVQRKPYAIPGVETDTCSHVKPTGPGQGTFNSGTQTPAGTEPPADTTLHFIRPFPVIRVAGRFEGKRTKLTRVSVRTPHGTRVRIRCTGRGCPYKRKAAAAKLIAVRSLQRTYRATAQIEFRVTEPQKIGKYTRVRMRRGNAPLRIDRCLMPGKSKPVKCPTS